MSVTADDVSDTNAVLSTVNVVSSALTTLAVPSLIYTVPRTAPSPAFKCKAPPVAPPLVVSPLLIVMAPPAIWSPSPAVKLIGPPTPVVASPVVNVISPVLPLEVLPVDNAIVPLFPPALAMEVP